MNDLHRRALAGLLNLTAMLAASVFLPAWTLHYWQAWLFLCAFLVPTLAVAVYLVSHDPQLLERRVNVAERQGVQGIILWLLRISFLTVLVLPALDHRFAWSHVPLGITLFGDFLVGLGLLIIFFVFRENTFTSSAIQIHPGQTVISTGPYALVRHPMYSGALVTNLGIPLALGSWWGLFLVIPLVFVVVWRLLEEEKFLTEHLPGYSEYLSKVSSRLVPLLW
jgi:protein-S-isoprenylcysteine O-methyltransferase Ste14